MKRLYFLISVTIAAIALISLFTTAFNNKDDGVIRIGHTGTPHLAPLFVAIDQGIFEDKNLRVELKQFDSTSDAGYALIAGRVDVVFIEPSRSFRLININENDDLGIKIAGTVNFPFGSTLVVREDLELRLHDLEGKVIAATDKNCVMLKQFKHDAQRYGVDTSKINFVYMDLETMLPALEAKHIDAMVTRASYALPAHAEGHKILYQNWEVAPGGDPCCPEYLAQVKYFMLVKDLESKSMMQLDAALVEASKRSAEDGRKSIMKHTQLAPELLQGYPVAHYQEVSEELKQELEDWIWKGN
ncbi:MAG: ABC transporter substrate-binding protein [Methanobacteriaceae archaeon]|jgi:ABC-type nitrate/sulfonate/bicarbonate transport system substrate-binding protein